MNKKENIKNYYIKKHIEQRKQSAKLNAKNIRLQKENTLENKLWENLISRMNRAYNNKNIIRTIPYKKLIGCDEKKLYNYLQNLLPKDVSMNDYPKWEIDHIKPIILFDLTNEEQQLECFNYKNLRPLDMILNRQKLEL